MASTFRRIQGDDVKTLVLLLVLSRVFIDLFRLLKQSRRHRYNILSEA
jgi:hypothetical protein